MAPDILDTWPSLLPVEYLPRCLTESFIHLIRSCPIRPIWGPFGGEGEGSFSCPEPKPLGGSRRRVTFGREDRPSSLLPPAPFMLIESFPTRSALLSSALWGFFLGCIPSLLGAQDDVSRAPDLPDPCTSVESWSEVGPVALANLQTFRGSLDFRGARVVGCLRNDGQIRLEQMMLEFESRLAPGSPDGSYGFTTNVQLSDLAPGAVTAFSSEEGWGSEMFAGLPIVGYQLIGLDLLEKDTYNRPAFPVESGPGIGVIVLDRPQHPLESNCRALPPNAGEGEVWISQARIEIVAPGTVPVLVGCLTNRTPSPLGEEEGGIPAQLEGIETAAPGGEGFVLLTGSLRLPSPAASGESVFFGSSFGLTSDLVDISVTPLRYDYERGTVDVVGTPLRLRERTQGSNRYRTLRRVYSLGVESFSRTPPFSRSVR